MSMFVCIGRLLKEINHRNTSSITMISQITKTHQAANHCSQIIKYLSNAQLKSSKVLLLTTNLMKFDVCRWFHGGMAVWVSLISPFYEIRVPDRFLKGKEQIKGISIFNCFIKLIRKTMSPNIKTKMLMWQWPHHFVFILVKKFGVCGTTHPI